MSDEFEKLEVFLYLSKPSERDPQVDRGEAAKLAARWGWMVHRAREQRVELPLMRRPGLGALGTDDDASPGRPQNPWIER